MDFTFKAPCNTVEIMATISAADKTGVEIAALTVDDMY